jgi:serine/threonine protein kinase
MKSMDHQKVERIFNDALELPADQRERFVSEECGADAELREEVTSLLAAHDVTFLEEDVSDTVLELIRGGLLPGDVIKNRYEIVELIGRGGMGEVYLALDPTIGRKVAVKVLTKSLSQDKKRVENFVKEARAASQINHQNILTVYDYIEEEGGSFIITEYVEGETLRKKLQAHPLGLSTALKITHEVASALEVAHQQGVVHRDIKPENIIVNNAGHVKILDFGIAELTERDASDSEPTSLKTTQTDVMAGFGTAKYMSPEQVHALYDKQKVDARSDIWSLGVCMYEMLTGAEPFQGGSWVDTFASILKDEPAPLEPTYPESLKAIVKKALQKNRDERYQTMGELRLELENIDPQPPVDSTDSTRWIDTFEEWRKTFGKDIWRALFFGSMLSLVISLAFAIYHSDFFKIGLSTWTQSAAHSVQAVGSLFHLILLTIAFGYFYKKPGLKEFRPIDNDIENQRLKPNITYSTGYEKISDWEQARRIAKTALRDYKETFAGLLFAWFFLYLCMLLMLIKEAEVFLTKEFLNALFTQANNLNTLCVWLCFRILNEPITTEDKAQNDKGIVITESLRRQIGVLMTAFVIMIFWFIFEYSLAKSLTEQQAGLLFKSSKLISGVFGGVAMALFVGRFQSKFLKSPDWLIITLYLYTVIQALFVFYGDQSDIGEGGAAVVIQAALFLKCLLILYMFWLFQSGRLLFYLVRVRRASTQVDSEWQNFHEVLRQEG